MQKIKQFEGNIKKSFSSVKKEVTDFKDNVSEWLKFLNSIQEELLQRVEHLEKKIYDLESEKIAEKISNEQIF